MAHMRKMALVDPRLLETLRTPTQPPIDTNLRDLDSEMTSILDKTGIDVREKMGLYNQALLRYNDMAKMSATKPTPVVVAKENETPPTTDIMGEVVTTLPKALQEKGRQLVSRLKTTQWNDRGELLHEGAYPAVTWSILSTIYHANVKRLTPSVGNSSGARCVQQTYPWNWSEMLLGGVTYSNGNGH